MTSFGEQVVPGFSYAFEGDLLHEERSDFQHIQVYEHASFGRMLVLDGLVQTSERDEFIYHEMLVHVPMMSHLDPKRVLVIGGGDGGSLRRVLEHATVERAVMVEIDARVIDLCATFMPSISAGAAADPRAEVLVADAVAYVAETDEVFDVVIVDSSEAIGPGVELFGEAFYANVKRILAPGGIAAAQLGSPFFQAEAVSSALRNLAVVFPSPRMYAANVPVYPGSVWSFGFAGGSPDLVADSAARGLAPRYWSERVHRGAFDLPAFVADAVAAGATTWEPWTAS